MWILCTSFIFLFSLHFFVCPWDKVAVKGQMFESVFRTFFKGFSWNLPQLFSLLWQCAEGMSQPFLINLKDKYLSQCFRVNSCLPHSYKDLHETWLKCLVHCDLVQKAWVSHFISRSQSHYPLEAFFSYLVTLILASFCVKNLIIKHSCASFCSFGS